MKYFVLFFYFFSLSATLLISFFIKTSWISALLFVVILPFIAIFHFKQSLLSLKELGLDKKNKWSLNLILGLLGGILIPIFFLMLQLGLGWRIVDTANHFTENMAPSSETAPSLSPASTIIIVLLFLKMIFSVVMEEFVFRGYFLNMLSKKTGIWPAVFLSSLLWATGHLSSMITSGLTPLLIIIGMGTFVFWGSLLCISFILSGKSLFLPFGIHLGMNLCFSSTGFFISTKPAAPLWIVGHPDWSPESGLVGLFFYAVLFCVLVLYINKSKTFGPVFK